MLKKEIEKSFIENEKIWLKLVFTTIFHKSSNIEVVQNISLSILSFKMCISLPQKKKHA